MSANIRLVQGNARIGSGRALSSEDREVGDGRLAGKGAEMAEHSGPHGACAVRVEHDHLRGAGAALAEECREVGRGLGAFDVAEGLAGGQVERGSVHRDAINTWLIVKQLIRVLRAAVAEEERVTTGAAHQVVVASATVDDVVACSALQDIAEAVAADDCHGEGVWLNSPEAVG